MDKKISQYTLAICLFVVFGLLLIAGCSVGPNYTQPTVNIDQRWQTADSNSGILDLQCWWKNFNDPVLESLISKVDTNSLDIKEALSRIEQARASYDYAAGRYYPNVDGIASMERYKISQNGTQAQGQRIPVDNVYTAGFDAVWEIDLFGQINRAVKSSKAMYEASIEHYNDVLISLFAEIARNYIMLQTTNNRIEVAQNNIVIQLQTADLTNDRYKAGLVPKLDVKQAQINLADTKAQIPTLQQQKIAYINRIAVLLGGTMQDYQQLLDVNQPDMPLADVQMSSSLSGNLLRRRPDIRMAERQLAAQSEQIGIAQADLYPSFNIGGSFTYSAVDFDKLTDNKSRGYSFGPSFRWNLFDGNRIRNNIKIQQAKTRQYQIQYEKKVLYAIEEVQNSLTAYLQESIKYKHLEDSAKAAQEAVILVKDLYENGLTDFQNVLDSQRTLFAQQDKLTLSRGQKLIDLISVYKALGGGWQPND